MALQTVDIKRLKARKMLVLAINCFGLGLFKFIGCALFRVFACIKSWRAPGWRTDDPGLQRGKREYGGDRAKNGAFVEGAGWGQG